MVSTKATSKVSVGTSSVKTLAASGWVTKTREVKWTMEILLMVQKSGVHQLRLVVVNHNLQGFIHPRWCRISSINSIKVSEMTMEI